MEVRKGYKQTEFGVIPNDWNAISIQELMDSNAIVGHLDGNHGALYPRSNEFVEFGVPYITANELTGYKVSFQTCKYLSQERARRFRKGVAKNGDVLFAHNATVGPTALLSTELDYVILSTTATYFRCNPEKIKNTFLLYALQSQHFVSQYKAVMAQSTRNQVPITTQRKLFFILPSTLAEQEAIAEALSDADALIESLETLLAKKRQVKQGAMSELLGGKRRVVESGEWEVKRLGDLGVFRGGNGFPTRFQGAVDGAYPFYKVSDMNNEGNSTFMIRSNNWVSEETRKQVGANTFPKNTIVFAKIGAAIFLERKKILSQESCIDNNMMGFILDEKITDYKFIHFLFLNIQLGKLVSATALPSLNGKELANLSYRIPPLPEQAAIAEILSDMDAEIRAVEGKLSKARAVKAGMMSELLTGRVRLV